MVRGKIMTIRDVVQAWYQEIFQPRAARVRAQQHFKKIIIGIIFVIVLGGGLWWYNFYTMNREMAAQRTFEHCLQEYQSALRNDALWPQVEMEFSLGYDQYAHTRLAPYFLVFKVDALLKQNKKEEAYVLMDSVLPLLSGSPLSVFYKTKVALMLLDMSDQDHVKKGLSLLEELAYDDAHSNSDVALYYLGSYYLAHNQIDNACRVWQKLVDQYPTTGTLTSSPWASLAREKLSQII